MKKSILTLVAAALALGACAESVSREMAITAANAWVLHNEKFGAGRVATGNVITVCDTNKAATVLWHQVSMTGDGCVIVAPVTEIEPVVVALDNDPGELPQAHPLRGILMGDMRQRLRFLSLYQEDPVARLQGVGPKPAVNEEEKAVAAEWAAEQEAKWARLGIGSPAALQASRMRGLSSVETEVCVVDGFEKGGRYTHWNQSSGGGGYCYNYYTPNHAVCGCVATATAALVQFFAATNGVAGKANADCTYNGRPCRSYEIFQYKDAMTKGGEYDWSLVEDCKKGSDYGKLSDKQRELLGRVAYDAAVGVGMMWTDDSSGAFEPNIVKALKDVFGFRNARYVDIKNPEHPNEDHLRKLVYGQCAAGAPVGISIEGHSVVVVGYGIDDASVERVRVFMGWGGSGDGWYALPYIDTKATMGGGNYLSKVVDGVVTMISYKDDDIVPVVGQMSAGGFSVSFTDVIDPVDTTATDEETGEEVTTRKYLPRVVPTTDMGWFATRVPPVAGVFTFTCAGKTGEYEVGADCYHSENAAKLAAATPEWFMPFPLLNSTVCFSFPTALKTALAEHKAILRVSGSSAETNTQCVLNYIYKLDEGNIDDFTNKFVYLFTTYSTTNGDVRPSYSVYLPEESKTEERWYYTNGRLSYGYGRLVATTNVYTITNIEEDVSLFDEKVDPDAPPMVTNIFDAVGTNVLVSTYAPSGAEAVYEVTPFWPTYEDTTREALERSIAAVIDVGWEAFSKKASGISVTVLSTGAMAGEPVPTWGTTTGAYTNGQEIVATAAAEMTNEVDGVVMGCSGYTLECSNTVSHVVRREEGKGTEVTFTAETGDAFTLIWNVTTNFVRITVATPLPKASAGTTEPGTGWYKYGEPVLFTARPAERWTVERWNGAGAAGLPEGSYAGGPCVLVTPTAPLSLNVKFRQQTTTELKAEGTNYLFTAVSYLLEVEDGQIVDLSEVSNQAAMPKLVIHGGNDEIEGTAITQGEEATLTNVLQALVLEPLTYTDRRGKKWQCAYWNFYDYEADETVAHDAGVISEAAVREGYAIRAGEGPLVGFTPSQDVKLVLYWMPVEGEDDPDEPDDPEVEVDLPIDWNDDLNNLHSGDVVLMSAEQAKKLPKGAKINLGTPPLGWKLKGGLQKAKDGSLLATLELDEGVLVPKGVDGVPPITIQAGEGGMLIVRAEIVNGVRGFWYSLYTADELSGPWNVVTTGYESGMPVKQAALKESVGTFLLSIVVDPKETKRFYKLVVTEKNPSVE